jgi:hypothetical protein
LNLPWTHSFVKPTTPLSSFCLIKLTYCISIHNRFESNSSSHIKNGFLHLSFQHNWLSIYFSATPAGFHSPFPLTILSLYQISLNVVVVVYFLLTQPLIMPKLSFFLHLPLFYPISSTQSPTSLFGLKKPNLHKSFHTRLLD